MQFSLLNDSRVNVIYFIFFEKQEKNTVICIHSFLFIEFMYFEFNPKTKG